MASMALQPFYWWWKLARSGCLPEILSGWGFMQLHMININSAHSLQQTLCCGDLVRVTVAVDIFMAVY